jgi:UDP-GlcNAc:undecaprenyl-phosphate GlcNAc-1-phosphate transferase
MENQDFLIYFGVISVSFLLVAVIVPLIIKLAHKYDITDNPAVAERKVHSRPIPLLGGWAVFLSSIIVIFGIKFLNLANFSQIPNTLLAGILVASLVIVIGGTLDDKYNLKPWQQIVFPLLAVLIVVLSGLQIEFVTNPWGETGSVLQFSKYLGILIVGAWLLGMVYTTKFLDGLDGLASGIGAIAALFIFLISLRWDVPLSATGIWGLALMGSCLGFLLFNWQPAKIFLGEGGSVLIGFTLGVLSVISGSKIITTLLVMGLPFLDVLFVIIKRLLSHQSPFKGDRSHLHYQLLDFGLSKKQVVLVFYFIAIGFGSLGVVSSSYSKMILLACLVVAASIISFGLKFRKKKSI